MTVHWFTEQLRAEPRDAVLARMWQRIADDKEHGRYSPDHREMARIHERMLNEHPCPRGDEQDCPTCGQVWPCGTVSGIVAPD